ncbi:hypothetical protein ACTMU2_03985 [Cupriavidus basilensis]
MLPFRESFELADCFRQVLGRNDSAFPDALAQGQASIVAGVRLPGPIATSTLQETLSNSRPLPFPAHHRLSTPYRLCPTTIDK